jgi:hypothetical protein
MEIDTSARYWRSSLGALPETLTDRCDYGSDVRNAALDGQTLE